MQDKTKEIKDLTIKGLEPEIHKLLAVSADTTLNKNTKLKQVIETQTRD